MGIQNIPKTGQIELSNGHRGYKKPKPGDEIIISGMAGKFPDSDDVYQLRDNLFNKVDLVSSDSRRWKPNHPEIPQRTGKLYNIDKFDIGFFGLTKTQSDAMDPSVRMALEKVYEAMVDAGHNPLDFKNTNTGVFVGSCFSETEKEHFYLHQISNGDAVTGMQKSMLAKRINYFYKLNGPSFVSDTACSSSLYALGHAYNYMKEELCDRAIVCTTNLVAHPMASLQFARLGVLSPDGTCKSFDDAGNGYARSEATVVLILEKSRDAKRLYAEIIHSKTNCDGYKEQGITFPSSEIQKVLLKEFYDEIKIDPTTLTFVEAHGTGTTVGDPQELEALDDIFCTGRKKPLPIGTVKSSIGHTEPASGLCSIVKVLIAMESGLIPPNIHYKVPRKGVEALEKGRMVVVTEKMPWPDNEVLVGINGFGFGGSNGHILLKWNPKKKTNNSKPKDSLPRLICVSGRTKFAIENIFDDASSRKLDAEFIKLIHQVYRKLIPSNLFRGYSIVTKGTEITRRITKLTSFQTELCVIFANVDKEWFQMGQALMAIPIFAGAIQKIHEALDKKLSINILSIIITSTNENYINQVLGTVSVQLAIAHVLNELNLNVDTLIGIGFGELICAYLEKFLTLEEVILSAYYIAKELQKDSNAAGKKILNELLCKSSQKPSRWVRIYKGNNKSVRHPLGSIDYLFDNVQSPITLEDCKKYIRADEVVLAIGNTEKQSSEKYVILSDLHGVDTIVNFLDSLGRIYLQGFDMELDKVYPHISLPVSRGTPMLSPLVKWDHSQNCKVFQYKKEVHKTSVQKQVYVYSKSVDWSFVTGHVIDGRNLFPATGYLSIVGETYFNMSVNSPDWTQVGIVFEDVKFIRAANVPTDDILKLTVMIQFGSKYFEVTENDTILVTGKVYELAENYKFADLPTPAVDQDEITLEGKDVYKELKLRGYNYKDQFRAIKKCNITGTNAVISWNNNWIAFMDNMLQIQILQEDTRNLYVPTSIHRLVINGPRQTKYASLYQNEIPVVCHKTLSLISGGGVEIRGLGASSISRRKVAEPVLETYKFIPYHAQLSEHDAVRCLLQIILENSNVMKVKAVEMDADKLFLPLVQKTLADLPLIQSELTVLSKKQLDMPGIQVEDKLLTTLSGYLLVIASDILNNNDLLEVALTAVRDSAGYIISYQSPNSKASPPSNIKIISSYHSQTGTLVLMQESRKAVDRQAIEISSSFENLTWIAPLKAMIKSNNQIILYSKNSEREGLLGLVNCLRKETNGSNIATVILMDEAPPFDMKMEFYKKQLEKNIAFNVWKDGEWGSYRHLLMPDTKMVESEHCYVNVVTRGDLSSLKWIEGSLSKNEFVEANSELVDIYYAAINFRDVMTATGRIQADVITRDRVLQECVEGVEFSGTDSSGRRVMGMASNGALSTMIAADKNLLWPIPPQWSLEDAATVPIVYGTVVFALLMRGGIKKGQSILIHSGTGAVGQAAINISLHLKCTIFTTVGTPEKREFIKKHFPQIKEEHIGDSRSTSFEQMVLKYTNGKGVDFVLNSLAEEKLQASVRCLAIKGTFLEIGKFDLASDNKVAINLLKKQASFQGVMLDQLFTGSIEMKRILTKQINECMFSGAVKPLMRTTFKSGEIETAFRYMATGKHMGKVLIKIRDEKPITKSNLTQMSPTLFKGLSRFSCKGDSTYIILGGLGGFGLELADWLVVRGAKKLVLTSRSGVKNGYQAFRLNTFKSYGTRVIIRNDDVASEKGCKDLLKAANALGPVDGIFNLAVVLQDALFENQTVETFKISLAPKAVATKNLDAMSRVECPHLRYFVIFSSVSCGRGNVGQTNYGMGNSIMERICEKRKGDGFPALAIQWGAIGQVGLVVEMQENHQELVIGGTLQQSISNCLQTMDTFLRQDETVVSSMVVAEKKSGSGANNIIDTVLSIVGIKNIKTVSMHATFPELGMDSMMAVEVKQSLEREYDVLLTAQDIRNMTLAKLKDMASATDDATPAISQGENDALPDDVKLLFRYMGDETTVNIPMVRMSTAIRCDEKAPMVFGLAGIEGMATVFEPIAKHMKFHFTCLQLCAGNQAVTIEEYAKSLVIESSPGNFSIIAYSFGCVVAIELMRILEKSGKTGKALFIDGAPSLLIRMVDSFLPKEIDEYFETSVLCIIMMRFMPFGEIIKHKGEIMNQKTYEEKIRYMMSVSPETDHSESYIIEMAKAALNRVISIKNYQPKAEKLNSNITLVKPTQQMVVNIEDDYNLSSICTKEVKVHTLEGNHVDILENEKLRDIIDELTSIDSASIKDPVVYLADDADIGIKNT